MHFHSICCITYTPTTGSRWYDHEWLKADYKPDSSTHLYVVYSHSHYCRPGGIILKGSLKIWARLARALWLISHCRDHFVRWKTKLFFPYARGESPPKHMCIRAIAIMTFILSNMFKHHNTVYCQISIWYGHMFLLRLVCLSVINITQKVTDQFLRKF